MKTAAGLVVAAVLLGSPGVALGHHSYAMYDQTRRVTVQGTVHALEWTNPHIWVWVVVKGESGASTTYGFESNAPSELSRFFGWNKRALAVGESVTVEYSPLKSGRSGGALRTITCADGRVLRTPRSDPEYVTGPRPSTAPAGAGREAK
jgi:hypothetical protein